MIPVVQSAILKLVMKSRRKWSSACRAARCAALCRPVRTRCYGEISQQMAFLQQDGSW